MTNETAQKLKELAGTRVNIASISDIHLNHANTPTWLIIRNLNMFAFPDNKITRDLDIIFIAGDFTDSLMDFASTNALLVRQWVAQFLRYCKKHDIMLRVLEGTPLHDWKQSVIFTEENVNHHIGCDVQYFTDIAIEHIDRYNLDILYIPDEARPTTGQTWERVQQLLKDHHLEKVDYCIMHGAFAYQLPIAFDEVKDKVHDEKNYLGITRHYILIGHVHQHRPKGKIIPHGSFDRLCQGEEDVKGHVRITKGKVSFIPNKGAMRYFALDVSDMEADEILSLVEKRLEEGNEDPFFIRLLANETDVAFGILRRLSALYPYGRFDVRNKAKLVKVKERKEIINTRLNALPALTRDNLIEELYKELELINVSRVDPCIKIAENVLRGIR